MNIIGNAVKFTGKGSVSVNINPVSVSGEDMVVRFSITDTGIGIPKEKTKNIFAAFSQVDSSMTRRYGGTGLGLAITKQLVELMGGTIEYESLEGTGSTFRFTIPLRLEAQSPSLKEVADATQSASVASDSETLVDIDGKALNILVAEDDAINVRVLVEMLELGGARFQAVGTGVEALEAWRREAFDLIIMDVQMPEMSGLEATETIRAAEKNDPETGKHIPIIALTGHAAPEDHQLCLAAGMDAYLTKPFRMAELFSQIEASLQSRHGGSRNKMAVNVEPQEASQSRIGFFDRAALLRRVGGKETLVSELIGHFLKDLPMQIEEISNTMNEGDFSLMEHQAHRLNRSIVAANGPGSDALHDLGRESNLQPGLLGGAFQRVDRRPGGNFEGDLRRRCSRAQRRPEGQTKEQRENEPAEEADAGEIVGGSHGREEACSPRRRSASAKTLNQSV
jgi:CheY-like chemotaxis protein